MTEPLIELTIPKALQSIAGHADEAASAWAAGQIDAEIVALRTLATEVDALQHRAVTRARSAGLSWAQIAALLGVSKQAAHKRYGVNEG